MLNALISTLFLRTAEVPSPERSRRGSGRHQSRLGFVRLHQLPGDAGQQRQVTAAAGHAGDHAVRLGAARAGLGAVGSARPTRLLVMLLLLLLCLLRALLQQSVRYGAARPLAVKVTSAGDARIILSGFLVLTNLYLWLR